MQSYKDFRSVAADLCAALQYEEAAYDDALKTMPERAGFEDGTGTVVDTATLKAADKSKKLRAEPKVHKTEVYVGRVIL